MRVAALAGVVAVIGASGLRSFAVQQESSVSLESRLVYLPGPDTMERWSFGYREALADLIFIRGNLVTAVLKQRDEHQWISRYFEVLHRLDPRFRGIYRWAAVASIYSGLRVVERDFVEMSQHVYDLALEQYPTDHEFLWYGGMVEFSEVSEVHGYTAEEVAAAKLKGAERIRRAASSGASPLVRRLAITLGRDANGAALDLERAYLRSQILTSADEEFQEYAKKRLLELSGAAEADRLEQLREDFVRRHAQNFPYVPPPTYVMVESE